MSRILPILVLVISIFLIPQEAFAQGCDGSRYLTPIASETTVTTVKFGENTTVGGNFQELMMDIYQPQGDTQTDRPAIIFAYGGSFIGGTRQDPFVVSFCERYAKLGYVTAALDYRLFDLFTLPDSLGMIDEVIKAVADMKGAVRYLKKTTDDGNPYNINPNMIFVGGLSAGAITACHTAYVTDYAALPDYVQMVIDENGGIDGDTDNPDYSHINYSSSVRGVINLSGGLHKASWITPGAPPVVGVHGDNDDIVPYGHGFATVCVLPNLCFDIVTIDGSSIVHTQAQTQGINSEFYSVTGGGHVDFYADATHATNYDNMVRTFLHNEVCNEPTNTEEWLGIPDLSMRPNPSTSSVEIISGVALESVQVYNQVGKLVSNIEVSGDGIVRLQKQSLGTGIFFVTCTSTEGGVHTERIIFY